jgi:hypothetical protein
MRGTAEGLSTMLASEWFAGVITERPTGKTCTGGGSVRPARGWRSRERRPGGSWPMSSFVSTPSA